MSTMGLISLLCLILTGALSTWAIFSLHYDDSVLQRLGLSVVAIGTITRAVERVTSDVPDPPVIVLASQIGIALYAIGTAAKLIAARRKVERRHVHTRRGLHA